MAMTVVAAGPNCDRIRSAGATAPSMPDRQTAKLRNRQAARLPDRQAMRRPGRGFARCPCSITSAKPGQCHKGGIGMAGQAWQGQSRAEQSRAEPTRPDPTQPNPTREMQDRRIGKGTDQIAGCIQARRSFWLPGLRSGRAKRALGAGFRGGVDLSSPWRGLNCQLWADGQCVGNEY
ncbi:hypothetical protein SAMN02744133_11486 [Thalassospira xiamenensis M-5 = DSM 17429]|uniref:Uncharacterized protein n=1 Tax=Thalassospira xiamenensis M-5 = DSM 17429 TaxID=1123366 RepID=A0AB72UFK7_9PROT|nr:hypothetical protein TH3_14595 [Thalassospira xiamenensis M-5 = DSM 17429]SIT29148.1 hypothetical protein SAMN02744133_11486 [Thalassospira xiamenensis M-5 = DSM 17429]